MIPSAKYSAGLLPGAIAAGLILGSCLPGMGPSLGSLADPLLFGLLALLFLEVRFKPLFRARRNVRFLVLAWCANFVLIPLLGWGIASLFFPRTSPLFAGLLLYFLFPCTDWFLGFTRMAKGDVSLGTVVLPLNLITQLVLFPVYLGFISSVNADTGSSGLQGTLTQWFLLPLGCALLVRFLLSRLAALKAFRRGESFSGKLVPWVIAAVVVCLFAENTTTLAANPFAFVKILFAVSLFFLFSYAIGEVLARRFRLPYEQHALLAMTTAARNAPLILGLTMVALPDEPLIHAALIIGLLVEFPHLIVLVRLFSRKERAADQGGDHGSPGESLPLVNPTHRHET